MDDEPVAEAVGADEAFATLSDSTRIAILRELWTTEADQLGFAELREAVGVADSGQFNYHLDKLTDRFVRKTDEGYELAAAGIRVVGAILGGAYTMEGSADPIDLDAPCPTCGSTWQFRYEREFATFDCEHCPITISYPVPPGTFAGAEPAEMPGLTERYLRSLLEQLRNGLCPYCESRTHPTVVRVEPSDGESEFSDVALVEYDCTRCSGEVTADLGTPLLGHPAVVSFFYEHGVDVRDRSIWEFSAFGGGSTAFASENPLRVTVTFEADGDELAITVDEAMAVREIERS